MEVLINYASQSTIKYSQAVLARIKSINCRTDKLEPPATIYVYCLETIEEKLHLSITTIETKGSQ